MKIRLVKRNEIDAPKWNGCVHYAANSKIYAYTWYLDNVASEWWGLVEGDYESVFPLIWNDKLFKTKQLYQPLLCQQLGIFSVNVLSKERIKQFLEAIPKEFKYWDIALNDGHKKVLQLEDYQIQSKDNYILYLNKPYQDLYKAYSTNIKRNIKKAQQAKLSFRTDLKPEIFVAAVKNAQELKGVHHPEALYHAAHRIIYNCLHRGKGAILSVYNAQQELCAAVFLMFDNAAMINLLNVSTEKGKNIGAMAFLLDSVIQREAEKPKYIDFEGSSVPGIARFYESFGAENQPYFQLKNNKLPWWLKWRKK